MGSKRIAAQLRRLQNGWDASLALSICQTTGVVCVKRDIPLSQQFHLPWCGPLTHLLLDECSRHRMLLCAVITTAWCCLVYKAVAVVRDRQRR